MYAGVCERIHLIHHKRRSVPLSLDFFQIIPISGIGIDKIFILVDTASEKCQQEKRKTVNGEDILFAMTSLGFENYAEALKIYLSKYREVSVPGFSSLL